MSANYDPKVKFVQVATYCFLLCIQVHACICVPKWGQISTLVSFLGRWSSPVFDFWDKASHWPETAHCARLASSEPSLHSLPSAEIINTSQLFQLFYPGLSNSGPQASVSAGILLTYTVSAVHPIACFDNMVVLKHSHIHTFTYCDCFCSTATEW